MMPTLPSLMAQKIVSNTISDEEVVIMTTLSFQCGEDDILVGTHLWAFF